MAYGMPHPEAQAGEVWFTNATAEMLADGDIDCPWKSQRRGIVAFDRHDNPLPGAFPVFVMRDELVAAGVDPDAPI